MPTDWGINFSPSACTLAHASHWKPHETRDMLLSLTSPYPGWFPKDGRPPGIYATWPRQAKGPVPAQCPRLQGKDQMFELFLVYKRNVCSDPDPLCLHDRKGWGWLCTFGKHPWASALRRSPLPS